jgi:hypothetical protein
VATTSCGGVTNGAATVAATATATATATGGDCAVAVLRLQSSVHHENITPRSRDSESSCDLRAGAMHFFTHSTWNTCQCGPCNAVVQRQPCAARVGSAIPLSRPCEQTYCNLTMLHTTRRHLPRCMLHSACCMLQKRRLRLSNRQSNSPFDISLQCYATRTVTSSCTVGPRLVPLVPLVPSHTTITVA